MFNLKSTWIAVFVALMLTGCGGGSDNTPHLRVFSQIKAHWAYSDLNEDYVVSTDSEWTAIWRLHGPREDPEKPPEKVDFESQMVLGLTRGTGSSGCYSLEIRRVTESLDFVVVEYVQPVSRPASGCTAEEVQLTDFVVTAKSSKLVRFVKTDA